MSEPLGEVTWYLSRTEILGRNQQARGGQDQAASLSETDRMYHGFDLKHLFLSRLPNLEDFIWYLCVFAYKT